MRCGGILSRIKNGGELFKISEKINVILIQASSALPDWSDQKLRNIKDSSLSKDSSIPKASLKGGELCEIKKNKILTGYEGTIMFHLNGLSFSMPRNCRSTVFPSRLRYRRLKA